MLHIQNGNNGFREVKNVKLLTHKTCSMTHKDDRRPTAIGPLSGSDDLKIHSKEKNNVVLTVHEGNLIIFIFNFRIYFSFDFKLP